MGAGHTVLKLAKRNGGIPCLCLDAATTGSHNSSTCIQVHHAIPVRVRKHSEMQLPPRHAVPDVCWNCIPVRRCAPPFARW